MKQKDVVKEQAPKILKYKIIAVGDYYERAKDLPGEAHIWDKAVALLYTENKVVAVVTHKGEDKFLVEV